MLYLDGVDADAGVKSKAGFTPLHMAAQEGHEDCVEMLIERGADVNVPASNGELTYFI